jgi:hypothetical protein
MNHDIEIQTHKDGTIIAIVKIKTVNTERISRRFISRINPDETFRHCGSKYNLLKYIEDSIQLKVRVEFYWNVEMYVHEYENVMYLKIMDDSMPGNFKLKLKETYDLDDDSIELLRGENEKLKEINEYIANKFIHSLMDKKLI